MTFDDFSKLTDTKHARVIKSIIGISRLKFDILANAFAETHSAIQHERCTSKKIKRVQSGGSKGNLDSPEKKLFFTLFYLKTYPTFDVLGFHFGFSSGHAHNHLKNLLPVLLQSLLSLGVLPVRTVGCPEEFTQLIEKYEDIAIDGLECACVRPLDKELQKARYSGKKKAPHIEGPRRHIIAAENYLSIFLRFRKYSRLHSYENDFRSKIRLVQ